MQGIESVMRLGGGHGEVGEVDAAYGIVGAAGREVGLEVGGKACVAPLVGQVDGLWRELVDGGLDLYVFGLSLALHDAVDGQLQVGVVDAQRAVDVVGAVESVDGNVLVLVSLVVELLDVTVGLDADVALGGQLTVEFDLGGKHAELIVVQAVAG